MMMTTLQRPAGLVAIDREMARQMADAIASFDKARIEGARIATALRKVSGLLMLGMGASHAVGRAVAPLYRKHGVDALAVPISEQLAAPLSVKERVVLLTSQSGESAEVLRWLDEDGTGDVFGLTLEAGSTLASKVPSLIGAGGAEQAFAATRSLTVGLAQHMAILAALGEDPAAALAALESPREMPITAAVDALEGVDAVVTSGRSLQGLAEAAALGMTELSRRPCFSLEGGQLRHGPMEMLGPRLGVVAFRADEAGAPLISGLARDAAGAGSPVVMFDASGLPPVSGAVTMALPRSQGLAAMFAILPQVQRFMIEFAARRVADAGTPIRSTKITRSE